jgi:hypothetical protein
MFTNRDSLVVGCLPGVWGDWFICINRYKSPGGHGQLVVTIGVVLETSLASECLVTGIPLVC